MFNFTLPRTLSKGELQLEKAKDYRNIVVMQILIVVFGLTLSEPIFEDSKSDISKLIITVFSFFGALYTYLMCDMLRNFTNNKISSGKCHYFGEWGNYFL